jgi:hypothetical protein
MAKRDPNKGSTRESGRDDSNDRTPAVSEAFGGVVDEITSSWFFGDALSRIVDAGERVMHAQQSAISALGLPSGSQFESLTLRVRTLFHRIEELEDDLDRIERRVAALEHHAADSAGAKVPGTKTPGAKSPRAKGRAATGR